MNQSDNEFFEEFKELERLCRDIYGRSIDNKLGVSQYIEDMEKNAQLGRYLIQRWDDDYRMLKKCRYIRNQLAHESYPTEGLSTREHIAFVSSFRASILNRTDPLALLEKHRKTKTPSASQSSYSNMDAYDEFEGHSSKSNYNFAAMILIACIGIVLFLTFCIFALLINADGLFTLG